MGQALEEGLYGRGSAAASAALHRSKLAALSRAAAGAATLSALSPAAAAAAAAAGMTGETAQVGGVDQPAEQLRGGSPEAAAAVAGGDVAAGNSVAAAGDIAALGASLLAEVLQATGQSDSAAAAVAALQRLRLLPVTMSLLSASGRITFCLPCSACRPSAASGSMTGDIETDVLTSICFCFKSTGLGKALKPLCRHPDDRIAAAASATVTTWKQTVLAERSRR